MKRVFLFLLVFLLFKAGHTQCPYKLSVSNANYIELENPISVNEGTVWDENDSFTVELGFDLPVSGGMVSSIGFEPGYGFSLPSEGRYDLFLFYGSGGSFLCDREHNGGESESPLDYEIAGSLGNRIVKLQWTNAGFVMDMTSSDYFSPTFQDYINFQIWFYEADGQIEIHFGSGSVVNSNSYGYWNGEDRGPWSKFIIGNNMIDVFGLAESPSYEWISHEGIHEGRMGRMLLGIPDERLVYTFSPDFVDSQVSYNLCPYKFEVETKAYTVLENPISINDSEIWNRDNGYPIFLDFDIPIFGGVSNSVNIHPGFGFNFPAYGSYHLYFFHLPVNTGGPLLQDRGVSEEVSKSALDYEITGNQGERIVKVQWENAGFRWDMDTVIWQGYVTATFSDWIDFQIWFYEEDGRIEIHFGPQSILNPGSYLEFNRGPRPIFWIKNYWMDLYGDPDNPSYNWFDPWGSWNSGSLSGIPKEGTVLIFVPDFTASIDETDSFEDEISVRWNAVNNELLFDFKDIGETQGHVAVYSIVGQILFTGELYQNQRSIKIGHMPEGILIVKLIVNNKVISRRIITGH